MKSVTKTSFRNRRERTLQMEGMKEWFQKINACSLSSSLCVLSLFFSLFSLSLSFLSFFHNVAWCVFVLEGAPREQSPDNRNFPHLSEHIFSLSYSPSLVSRTFDIVIVFSTEIIRRHSTYDKVNRCLARYSPRATTTNRPTTGHWISLHGLALIVQKCQIWSFLGKKS